MNKSEYENPQDHIFYCDKSKWYVEKDDGSKDWSLAEEKVKEFWRLIRDQKIEKSDYDLSEIIFPNFPDTARDCFNRTITSYVNFSEAVFLSEAEFSNTIFEKAVFMNKTIFFEDLILKRVTFNSSFQFENCKCQSINCISSKFSDTNFILSEFQSTGVNMRNCFSDSSIIFDGCKMHDLIFSHCRFSVCQFDEISLNTGIWKNCDFSNSFDFSGSVVTNSLYFTKVKFSDSFRSSLHAPLNQGKISFKEIIFPSSFQLRYCDISKTSFNYCEISKIDFSECEFLMKNGKIQIRELYPEESLVELRETYRQIKRNRMDAKDWYVAGNAYHSEMVIGRKLYWSMFINSVFSFKSINFFISWFIRSFFEIFSGYNQSMVRPIYWLLVVIISSTSILFFFDHQLLNDALALSLKTSFPLIGKIDRVQNDWIFFFLVFDRIMSVILITFFILATRSRLRQ